MRYPADQPTIEQASVTRDSPEHPRHADRFAQQARRPCTACPGQRRALPRDVADALVKRFGDDPPPGRRYVALDAQSGQSRDLHKLGRDEEALAVCGAVIERYGREEDLHARTRVAETMRLESVLLAGHGREAEAAAVVDALVLRFGDATEPELRSVIVEVRSWKMADSTRARRRRRERRSILI
jgi:hypothetical protein